MTEETKRDGKVRGLDACRAAIEAHFAAHGTIPSMAGLARLWGYASKSSASRQVDELIGAGILQWSPDRRLAPGPAFRITTDRGDPPRQAARAEPMNREEGGDPLPAALTAWASGYDPALVRSYSVTTRLLRLARSMEMQISRSAASEGLTSGDVLLLDALYRVGPPHRIAPTALKHYFLMSLAGVAKRVDRLEAQGFIQRIPNPDDKRGLFIQLTEAGRAALSRLVEADRAAPHIIWPMALTDPQYHGLLDTLEIAENIVSSAEIEKNNRS